jgi:hypothetical protein
MFDNVNRRFLKGQTKAFALAALSSLTYFSLASKELYM